MDDERLRNSEIFAKSHAQVLEDLKLLDEKLGRIVISLAFLTAAAVALFSKLADHPESELLSGSDVNVVTVSAFAFLTFIVAAGLSLLVALAGTLMVGLPPNKRQRKSQPSLLFFKEISTNPGGWKQLDKDSINRLTQRLAADFHTDALEIAKRARYKQFRALESLAFLHLAIVSLVLLAIFSAKDYDIDVRWWIASGFLAFSSLLPFVDVLDLCLAGNPEGEGHLNWTYGVVLVTVVIAALLLIRAPYWGGYWYALSYALFGAILAPRVALVSPGHAWVVPLAMVTGLVSLHLAWPG